MPPSIDVPMPPCIDGDTITFELRGIDVVNTGPTVSFRGTLSLERGTHVTEAEAAGMAVVAVGHHASERFSMDVLADRLAAAVAGLACWASRDERDPLGWL